MSEIAKTLGVVSCCALLLALALGSGPACIGHPFTSGTPTPEPGAGTPEPGAVQTARTVQFFNCNPDAGTGRVYNLVYREDGGMPVSQGLLNPQAGTNCHDSAHVQNASLTVDMFAIQPGKWKFRLVKVPFPSEPPCDSSGKDVPNKCDALSPDYVYQTVQEAALVTVDVASP